MNAQLGPMLLYVDVTNACPIGCAFCMYLPVQGAQHLELDEVSTAVLGGLVKASPVLHISGQGEPLLQPNRVLAVAALAGPGQSVEVITSGAVPWPKLRSLLEQFETLAQARGFTPRMRLSVDRWHASAVRHRNYAAVIRRSLDAQGATTRISFRSVTSERDWLPGFFKGELNGTAHQWNDGGPLRGSLSVGDREFEVAMKRLVRPAQTGTDDALSLEQYLGELSRSKGRPFTLGNLACTTLLPGPDVTVRPDGKVQLYGLDGVRSWDLSDSTLDVSTIESAIQTDPVLRGFYETPFIEWVRLLRRDPSLVKMVEEAANPYWIVPALSEALGDDLGRRLLELAEGGGQ